MNEPNEDQQPDNPPTAQEIAQAAAEAAGNMTMQILASGRLERAGMTAQIGPLHIIVATGALANVALAAMRAEATASGDGAIPPNGWPPEGRGSS